MKRLWIFCLQTEESLISVVQEYPNLVILRSLTKFYSLPGLDWDTHPDRLQRWQAARPPLACKHLAAKLL